MNKNKVTVNELIEQLLLALRRNGYSEGSIHSSLVYELKRVSDYYQKAEVSFYEPAITLQYTMQHLKRYLAMFHEGVPQESKRPLFYVTHKGTMEPMNDDTARIRIYHYANIARELCSEVPQKVHPHMFRHSRAMHLYQHGMPLELVSQWLGHKNVVTTQIYAYADTEAKREAIHRAMGNKEVYHTQAYIEKDEDVLRRLYGL